jgi:hypothetical protein
MEKRKFTDWLNYEPTKVDLKIKYFEYFIKGLIEQSKDFDEFKKNNYSQLKVMNLLFFSCSANTDLLRTFDNWWALPQGHVEQDIHNYMRDNKGKFSFFRITRFRIELGFDFDDN